MKTIYLYTMNGTIEATASAPFTIEGRPGFFYQIKGVAGGQAVSIIVNAPTYQSRMAEDKPTFYSC